MAGGERARARNRAGSGSVNNISRGQLFSTQNKYLGQLANYLSHPCSCWLPGENGFTREKRTVATRRT